MMTSSAEESVLIEVPSRDHVIFEVWPTVAVNVLDAPILSVTFDDEGSDKVITGAPAVPATVHTI